MRKSLKPVEYTTSDGQTYVIPRGDLVCISAAVQNTLPELFHEPNTFNPDRHGGEQLELRYRVAKRCCSTAWRAMIRMLFVGAGDSSTWVKEGRAPETNFRELKSGTQASFVFHRKLGGSEYAHAP
eukprot:COSAG02_NODE_2318_length_9145_cov_41.373867_7_plen_126_part_00